MASTKSQLVGSRYQLQEQLGAGGMGAVYRAVDRLNGESVALKRMLLPFGEGDGGDEQTRVALSLEFRTLAALRHPNIISVIDYGFDADRQPYFTMRQVAGAQPIVYAARRAARPEQIRLLVEMLRALAYLHRWGIIHRDLKPANVLVNREARVYVLDFGLSVASSLSVAQMDSGAAGTPEYMAPELYADRDPSVASDLYAVGVIAYEIFAGHNPFEGKNIATVLNKILHGQPDYSTIDANIRGVVQRLMARDPAQRYPNAEAVIDALCDAAGVPLPAESAAVRESYLQASQFVGREAELGQLKAALADVLRGTGSAWLIGGESGVGKSRLVDELHIRAMVHGALTLRGQAVAEGGVAYQLWREPVRRLMLSTDVNDRDAGVLKHIVPDIDALLGRAVQDAPPLDGDAGRKRLVQAISDLLNNQYDPIVLIMEDLHWTIESLEVLARIVTLTKNLPLLVIGTYRDDEATDVRERLPAMQHMALARLDEAAIAALSQSMLGQSESHERVVDLLRRETEGNAFFIVEVVRALAEDAGGLADIGRTTLPQSVFVEGIKTVIQRRLNLVAEDARPLLKLAAVAGRQINLDLLHALEPGVDLDHWLTVCANAAVLDVMDGQWRFAHDKLRDGMIDALGDAERRTLHRRVAEAIETVYPNTDEHAVVLLELWAAAGDTARETYYLQIATQQAAAIGSTREALRLGHRALEQMPTQDLPRMRLLRVLGETYGNERNAEAAIACYEECLQIARTVGTVTDQIHALDKLGRISAGMLRDNTRARPYLEEAFRLIEGTTDQRVRAQVLNTMGILLTNEGDMAGGRRSMAEAMAIYTELGDWYNISHSLNNLGVVAKLQADYAAAQDFYQRALALRRENGLVGMASITLNNLVEVTSLLGDFTTAHEYAEAILAEGEEIATAGTISHAHDLLGLNAVHRGDLKGARHHFELSLTTRQRGGSHEEVAVSLNNLGFLLRQMGDYEGAWTHHEEAVNTVRDHHNPQALVIGLRGLGLTARDAGDGAAAVEHCTASLHYCHELREASQIVYGELCLGRAYRSCDDLSASIAHFQSGVEVARTTGVPLDLALAHLDLALAEIDAGQTESAQQNLREGLRITWSIGVPSLALAALVGYARLAAAGGDAEAAVELLTLASGHPAFGLVSEHTSFGYYLLDHRYHAERLHAQLTAALPPDQFDAAWTRGRSLTLDGVVANLLA